jgi:hypothetical protein
MNTLGLDFITANRRARAMYPALFSAVDAAISPPPDEVREPVLSNDAAAAIPRWTQDDLDKVGMSRQSSLPEIQTAWRAAGNSLDPARSDDIFDALVDATAKDRTVSASAAEQIVRATHRNLALKSDTIKTARKLGVELPSTSTTDAPQFSDKRGMSVDFAAASRKSMNVGDINPFKIAPPLANDMDRKAVRATYADAVKKHLLDNVDDTAADAHRKVMAAHPDLAKAMRKNAAKPDTDIDDDDPDGNGGGAPADADAATATANSRTALGNSMVLANENSVPLDLSKPFKMISCGNQWAFA